MTELLHLSALLPAAFGACCTVGGRRGSRVLSGFEGFAAVVMFVAMADVALGLGLVAPILWVAGLVALALAGLPLGRVSTATVSTSAGSSSTESSDMRDRVGGHPPLLHSSLGLIAMAGLLALMAAGQAGSVSGHHGGGGLLPVLVLSGSAGYVGYSAWRAVALYRLPVRNLLGCLEAASMAASVALMAGALAV